MAYIKSVEITAVATLWMGITPAELNRRIPTLPDDKLDIVFGDWKRPITVNGGELHFIQDPKSRLAGLGIRIRDFHSGELVVLEMNDRRHFKDAKKEVWLRQALESLGFKNVDGAIKPIVTVAVLDAEEPEDEEG